MTIAPLLGELRDTARAEAERRLADARAEAERLTAGAREQLARRRETLLRHRSDELARDRERRLDEARDAAARETLAASEQLVARVLSRAIERSARRAGGTDAARWLAATIPVALEFLPDGAVVLRSSDPTAMTVARRAAPGREIAVEAGESPLGVVAATAAGDVRVDATIERFLRAERPRLAQAIVARATESMP